MLILDKLTESVKAHISQKSREVTTADPTLRTRNRSPAQHTCTPPAPEEQDPDTAHGAAARPRQLGWAPNRKSARQSPAEQSCGVGGVSPHQSSAAPPGTRPMAGTEGQRLLGERMSPAAKGTRGSRGRQRTRSPQVLRGHRLRSLPAHHDLLHGKLSSVPGQGRRRHVCAAQRHWPQAAGAGETTEQRLGREEAPPRSRRATGCPCHGGSQGTGTRGRGWPQREGHWRHLAGWPESSPAVAPAACPAVRLWTPPVPRRHPVPSLWAAGSVEAVPLSATQVFTQASSRCPAKAAGGVRVSQRPGCSRVVTPRQADSGVGGWGKSRPAGRWLAGQPQPASTQRERCHLEQAQETRLILPTA